MNTPPILWIRYPTWWVPVRVSTELPSRSLDALQVALLALLDRPQPERPDEAQMAHILGVAPPFVDAALGYLDSAGRIANFEGTGWEITQGTDPTSRDGSELSSGEPAQRDAMVAWDPYSDRAMAAVWLDDRPPSWDAWDTESCERIEAHIQNKPSERAIQQQLAELVALGELSGFEAIGNRAVETALEGHRLSPRLGRPRKADIAIPVELRMTGPVVYRPQLAPGRDLLTSLDPQGWVGLRERLGEAAATVQRHADSAMVGPDVLRRLGFGSIHEARGVLADRMRAQYPDLPADVGEWVIEAKVTQRIFEAAEGTPRFQMKGWADALERCVVRLSDRLVGRTDLVAAFFRLNERGAQERLRNVAKLLGPSGTHLKSSLNQKEIKRLAKSVERNKLSVGERLFALGVAVILDEAVERRARKADAAVKDRRGVGLFPILDRATQARNVVSHPDRDAGLELLASMPEDVLALAVVGEG